MDNTVADISVLVGIQEHANDSMGLGIFNAKFAEPKTLTPEQKKEVEKHKAKIIAAEQAFRKADDVFMAKYKQLDQAVAVTQQSLEKIKYNREKAGKARTEAAQKFENSKSLLDKPLKSIGVGVLWEEPKVDRVSVNLICDP
jgi:hypothetical protein